MSIDSTPLGSGYAYSSHLDTSDIENRYGSEDSDSDSSDEEEEKKSEPLPPALVEPPPEEPVAKKARKPRLTVGDEFEVSAEQSRAFANEPTDSGGVQPTLMPGRYVVTSEPDDKKRTKPIEHDDLVGPLWTSIAGRGPDHYYTAAHLGGPRDELLALMERGEPLTPEWRNRLQTFVLCDGRPAWVSLEAAKQVEKWTLQNGLRGGTKGARWDKACEQSNVDGYANIFPRPLYMFHLENVKNKKPRSKPSAPAAGKTLGQQFTEQLAALKAKTPAIRNAVAYLDTRQDVLDVLGAWTDAQFDSSSIEDLNNGVARMATTLGRVCARAKREEDPAEAFQKEYEQMSEHDKHSVHCWVNCLTVADPSHALHLLGVYNRHADAMRRGGVKRPASSR